MKGSTGRILSGIPAAESRRKKMGEAKIEFKNDSTFMLLTPIAEIPKKDLIVLDGYVFDITELQEYAKSTPDKFYVNPHVDAPNFTDEAKSMLRKHPELSEFAINLDKKLESQRKLISSNTVDIIIEMLQKINREGIDGNIDPRFNFIEYRDKLSVIEQENLNNFLIQVPCDTNKNMRASSFSGGEALFAFSKKSEDQKPGVRVMKFSDALVGGNAASPCVKTLQIFLWQFVKECSPEKGNLIPEQVISMAKRDHYQLENKEVPNNNRSKPVTPEAISEEEEYDEELGDQSEEENQQSSNPRVELEKEKYKPSIEIIAEEEDEEELDEDADETLQASKKPPR